jgi:nucleotide-binding universal stress UspA family protein
MTIVVGFRPDRGAKAAISLAGQLARTAGDALIAVTVVPAPWPIPSMARVDGEYADHAAETGAKAVAEAEALLAEYAVGVDARAVWVGGRSASSALMTAATEHDADVIVVGPAAGGGLQHVVVGSTAERLLHSSPVAVAVAPRGYRCAPDSTVSRLTYAYSGTEDSARVLGLTALLAERFSVRMRLATFGVRGRTMYPPEVGLRAEDDVLAQWVRQSKDAQRAVVAELELPSDTETAVATGTGWAEALDELEWEPGEILVVGSSSVGPIARVFIGSQATRIIRHSPVSVIAVPTALAEETAG